MRRAIPMAFALLASSASLVAAQGREIFEWRGVVDREVTISMRGRDTWTQTPRGRNEESRGRAQVVSVLPREEGQVSARLEDGRGDVDVIQQPSYRNDYTTIVRVRDRSGGRDRYRVSAYWRSNGYGDNRGRDDRGRDDRGRDDRGGWGRDGRNGRDDRDGRYGRDGRDNGYGRSSFRWSGSVDDVVEIRLQGNRVEYRTLSGKELRDVRSDIGRADLPRGDVDLRLSDVQGRGSVRLVQQPSSFNGYTAIIRINDPQRGIGRYDFDVSWSDSYAGRR
jgi:hypothetical protein